jgi:predicted 2-oxoglutarate/Fe(II)-dependent dioxygenase YbiX
MTGNVPSSVCADVLERLSYGQWNEHKFHNPADDTYYTNPNEPHSQFGDFEQYKEICQYHYESVKNYVTELNKSYFQQWMGMSNPKFNRYNQGQEMALHVDHIREVFDGSLKGIPILSCITVLDNDAEIGGNFEICGQEVEMRQGDTIIFPSVFTYPHRVTK